MSLMGLFDIGRSGIFANQLALRVSSNNIANVNTPGYSRQDVIMQIANPVQLNGQHLGRGVGDVEMRRHFDNFTYHQILGQSSNYGRSFSLDNGLSHIEQIFNETQGFGLMDSMEEYFNAWQEVATNPDESAHRSMLLVKAEAFVNTARQIERDIGNTLKFINDEVADVVEQINVLSKNIAEINGRIMEVEAGGVETANVFRDQREKMMKDLAELVDYDWHEDKDGTVTVVAGRKAIIAGVESYSLSTSLDLDRNREIYNGSINVTSFIQGGKLGGFLSVRDDIENNSVHDLRRLVASITQETNYLHTYSLAAPTYDLDGNQGVNFFSQLQLFTRDETTGGSAVTMAASITDPSPAVLTLDEYDLVFQDATNFQVRNRNTGAVTSGTLPADSTITVDGITITIGGGAPAANDMFFISPLETAIQNFSVNLTDGKQIAAAKSAATLPGDNTNALDIIDRYSANISNIGDETFTAYYAEIVSTAGSMSQSAGDSLKFDNNLLFELNNRREAVSGVSLDEEAANLIRYQRAFEAGARIIKVTDELLEMIINL